MESCNFLQLLEYSQAMSHEHILLIIPINLSKNLSGCFETRAKNARLTQMFICGESSPKFQMYNEQKANGTFTREKSKFHN